MTPQQVLLIKDSFTTLSPQLALFARLFYERLFEVNPNIRLIFGDNQARQEQRLADMIATIVQGLDRLNELKPALWSLGRRHEGYGVRPADYEVFGDALLWTVQRLLGEAFTPDVAEAWRSLYAFVAGVMQGRLDRHASFEGAPPHAA